MRPPKLLTTSLLILFCASYSCKSGELKDLVNTLDDRDSPLLILTKQAEFL